VSENKTAAGALSRMGDSIHFERWGHPQCDVRQALPQAGAIGYSTEDAIALRDWLIRQFPLPPAPLPPLDAVIAEFIRWLEAATDGATGDWPESVRQHFAEWEWPTSVPDDRANTEGE
jgi:hypothetical protein